MGVIPLQLQPHTTPTPKMRTRTREAALFLSLLFCSCHPQPGAAAGDPADPTPAPWPEQFHALVYMNQTTTGKLVIDDLWYDWPNGRNFNIMQQQLSDVIYDLEWANGTSFYYTLGTGGSCRPRHFPVGIVRPDFLQGSTYLGRVTTAGFPCHLWVKLDFIWYYEHVLTKRPVRWDFFDGKSMHVMKYEEGAVLDDAHWQAPAYCFDGDGGPGGDRGLLGTREEAVEASLSGFAGVHRRLSFLSRHDARDHLLQSPKLAGFHKRM